MRYKVTCMNNASLFLSFFTGGKATVPGKAEVVGGFDIQRYTGKWYEIARLDHSFERGLINASATYSIMDGGLIKLLNQGYNPEKQMWRKAEGKAKFATKPQIGQFLLAFFGPFYASYNIIALDKADYNYALVCGFSLKFLWIIARQTTLPENITGELIEKAKAAGFDTDQLVYVKHDPSITDPHDFSRFSVK